MRELWIIANWKSNKNITEALQWIDIVGPRLERRPNLKVVVCPTLVALEEAKKAVLVGNYPLLVGAQDISPFDIGSHTGEDASKLLEGLADLVILGHSERRQSFGETDEMVAEKAIMCNQSSLMPVVCVQDQNTPVPQTVNIVAYEPVFAIGTGKPDTPDNAAVVAGKLKEKYGEDLLVLYGGSVNIENAKGFLLQEGISGVLVGKASLDAEEFIKIIEVASKI